MLISEAKNILSGSLLDIYNENEAELIATYVMEDIFNFKNNNKKILSEENIFLFEKIKKRLLTHEPWQYVVGKADFYGYKFNVNQHVLIPRTETEELVYTILQAVKKINKPTVKILDIGTGSGCIPITLALKNNRISAAAVDISTEALAVANINNEMLGTKVYFFQGDILAIESIDNEFFIKEKFDIIVSNPPYITQQEKNLMAKNVLDFEPSLALFVDNDKPLIFYEKISTLARQKLNNGGLLFFECNEFYANEVADMMIENNFSDVKVQNDMQGKTRIATGTYSYIVD
jgi:release factor glutamine methyltransferase